MHLMLLRKDGVCLLKRGILLVEKGEKMNVLTQGRPAALLPLLDEPLAGLCLHLFRRHGIEHVTVITTDDSVQDALGDGSLYRIRVDYAKSWPQGICESVCVLNGNTLTDADLSALEEQRIHAGADVATALGAITVSAERAAQIPAGTPAESIIPVLMDQNKSVYMGDIQGYGRCVTDLASYRQAQTDLLSGKVGMPVAGRRIGRAFVARDGMIPPDVRIKGRCFVGRYAKLGSGCVLGTGVVIGRGAQVGRNAYLENTCLMENACVDSDAILRNVMIIPQNGNQLLQNLFFFSARES